MDSLVASRSATALLAAAIVRFMSRSGEEIYLCALIDAGSQSAFITEQTAQWLKVPKPSIPATISRIRRGKEKSKHSVFITMYSRSSENRFDLTTEAIVLPKLKNFVTTTDDLQRFEHLRNLCLADTIQGQSEPIDLILWVVEHAKIIKVGLQKGSIDEPIAQNSEFGLLVLA